MGFTSFPKEVVLRIFFALKNPTASGWVPKASTQPLDHRSRRKKVTKHKMFILIFSIIFF
jgi:hypothetical protein